MSRQASWLSLSGELTRRGRLDVLRRYRVLRRAGVPRDAVRRDCKSIVHGVWMAKKGGW